jgi:hypothetical protein
MVVLFVVVNLILIGCVGWYFGGDLRETNERVRAVEQRYFAERRLAAEYEENLREYAEIRAAQTVMCCCEKLPRIAEISVGGAESGLASVEFSAGRTGYLGGNLIFETRVSAVYEGEFADAAAFLQDLAVGDGKLRSFVVDFVEQESVRVRFDYSLFGVNR